jgi:cytochrome c oxidase subunit 2
MSRPARSQKSERVIGARAASLLGLACAAMAGCSGPQNYMSGAGPAARSLAQLGWFVLALFVLTTVVVWLLLAWITTRRRGSFAEHAPIDADGGQNWILIGGIAIPTAVLSLVLVLTLQSLHAFPLAHASGHSEPDIRVVAQQWWFDAEYLLPDGARVNSPTEIHVPVGRPVDIRLESRDVIHSFWVPKLHGKVDLVPGRTNYVRIQADEPGVYVGQCAEYCGVQHAHMRVAVIAQPEADYAAWLKLQSQPAAAPETMLSRRGAEIFQAAACPLCHTIEGTRAQGSVGPELTHVASRRYIAGGMLENNPATLRAWVTHAQSLKPGAKMPDLATFTGDELQALVAYLETLE